MATIIIWDNQAFLDWALAQYPQAEEYRSPVTTNAAIVKFYADPGDTVVVNISRQDKNSLEEQGITVILPPADF